MTIRVVTWLHQGRMTGNVVSNGREEFAKHPLTHRTPSPSLNGSSWRSGEKFLRRPSLSSCQSFSRRLKISRGSQRQLSEDVQPGLLPTLHSKDTFSCILGKAKWRRWPLLHRTNPRSNPIGRWSSILSLLPLWRELRLSSPQGQRVILHTNQAYLHFCRKATYLWLATKRLVPLTTSMLRERLD